MSRNPDGTVVLRTPGKLAQTPTGGNGMRRVDTTAYNGFNGGGLGPVFVGPPKIGSRIVSRTER